MKIHIWILLFALLPGTLVAQKWKRERHELFAGLGTSNFLGELGGADKLGSNFFTDLEISLTRPAIVAGYRYRLAKSFTAKGILSYARINGDDRLTNERFRNNRNLHFRAPLLELSPQLEWYFMKEERNKRYRLRGIRGKLNLTLSGYLMGGVSLFYFNPKGKFNGEWHALQPLGTEGQDLEGGPNRYSRISIGFPVGFGFKYHINSKWGLNMEFAYRFTLTDYLDDVSGNYYDNDVLLAERGEVAAALADPSLGQIVFPDNITVNGAGMQRGNADDRDAFMIGSLMLTYKLSRSRSSRPKF